jgi:hypothetical protein
MSVRLPGFYFGYSRTLLPQSSISLRLKDHHEAPSTYQGRSNHIGKLSGIRITTTTRNQIAGCAPKGVALPSLGE